MRTGKVVSGVNPSGPATLRQQEIEFRRLKRKKLHLPVLLFLLALVVPWVIFIAPLRMSLYRFVLLVTILLCLGRWIAGKAGRIRFPDISLLLFSFWCTLSYGVNNGVAVSVQSMGIEFLETVGPYFLARCYIRDAEDFHNAVLLLFRVVTFLLPFSIIECVTGQNILRELFAVILPTRSDLPALRGGLTRVQSVFDHPILFGVCTGSIVGLVHLVLGHNRSFFQRNLRTGIVAATSALSLSSGPIVGVVIQAFLLGWNAFLGEFKIRWKILIGILVSITVAIEMVANRSAIEIVTTFFVFDPASYWFRRIIWEVGMQSVFNQPYLGVGKNDWERPEWMPPSIDNFWLAQAVSHGLPAAFLLLLTFFSIFLATGFKKRLGYKLSAYRAGFLISMTGFFLVGWTVAFWDAAYVLFLFLMGSGVWMLDVESKEKGILQLKGV